MILESNLAVKGEAEIVSIDCAKDRRRAIAKKAALEEIDKLVSLHTQALKNIRVCEIELLKSRKRAADLGNAVIEARAYLAAMERK